MAPLKEDFKYLNGALLGPSVSVDTLYQPHLLIREAARHGELVVFVGAGVSKLCGSPDWREFADQVVETLERANVVTFLEAEQLRGMGDPRRTLSIAVRLAKEKSIQINFDRILHPGPPKAHGAELYELLASLRPVFVTTNYDKWLDNTGPVPLFVEGSQQQDVPPITGPTARPKYYRREHLTSDILAERGAVIHFHGSYSDPDSMVISLRDYIVHYTEERVRTFLREMFRNYTVLFVGYGLSELEILEHIIRANEISGGGASQPPRHFILYAYRTSEAAQTRFVENYFKEQCGVEVLPYCIDSKGYGEVVQVFRSWASQLDVRDPTLLDLQAHLDGFIADAIPSKRESAIRLVSRHPELTAYFMNSLSDPLWFDEIESAGFFNTEHAPGVNVETKEDVVTYQAEMWPALRYLERISPLVAGKRAERIAEFVRAVTEDANARG